MSTFEIALLIVLVYICVFALVNRICKCCENCALAKAYGTFKGAEVTAGGVAGGVGSSDMKGVANEKVSDKC